ncbi:MAG: flippase-like domain-containing protein, partial [Clostridia bacterium]|nr:flippase-like domain-containing protein [Clostridia bacterium]
TIKKNKPITSISDAIIVKYYDRITPLGGGGQPFEIYYLRKKGLPIGIASGVPLVSYALNKIAYVFVSLIALMIYGFGEVSIFIKILCLVGLSVNLIIPTAIVMFALMPRFSSAIARLISKIGKKLHLVKNQQEFYEKMTGNFTEYAECIKYFLHKSKISIIVGFICSIAYFVAIYSLPYFTIRMSGVHDVNWGRIFTYCVICYASITLLPTPGGSGGAELSFRSIFESYLSGGILFWSMLSWRIFSYYIYIFLGLGLIIYQQVIKLAKREGSKKKKAVEIEPEDELDPYTPIPATVETADDDINTAVPLTVAEATLEPDIEVDEILPEILEAEPVEFDSVAEFTAVIESKSTVTITEEHIEIQEKPVVEEHQISMDELLLGESGALEEQIDETNSFSNSSSNEDLNETNLCVEPVLEQLAVEQLTTEQPTTEQPTVEQPPTEQPTAEEVKAEQPVEESNLKEISTTQQDLEENLLVEQSTTEQPTTEQLTTEQPTTEQPTAEEIKAEQPAEENNQTT